MLECYHRQRHSVSSPRAWAFGSAKATPMLRWKLCLGLRLKNVLIWRRPGLETNVVRENNSNTGSFMVWRDVLINTLSSLLIQLSLNLIWLSAGQNSTSLCVGLHMSTYWQPVARCINQSLQFYASTKVWLALHAWKPGLPALCMTHSPSIRGTDRGALVSPKLFKSSMTEYNIEAHSLQDVSGDHTWFTWGNDMRQNLASVWECFSCMERYSEAEHNQESMKSSGLGHFK